MSSQRGGNLARRRNDEFRAKDALVAKKAELYAHWRKLDALSDGSGEKQAALKQWSEAVGRALPKEELDGGLLLWNAGLECLLGKFSPNIGRPIS